MNSALKKNNTVTKSYISITASYLLFGFSPILWKQMQSLNTLYVLLIRILGACLFYGIFILYKHKTTEVISALKKPKELFFILLSSIMITANWGANLIAVITDRILDASLASYISPILAILLGVILYKDKINFSQKLSILLMIFAVLYQIISYRSLPYLSIVIALTFPVYGVLKKNTTCDYNVSLFLEMLIIAPICLGIIIFMHINGLTNIETLSSAEYIYIPLSGFITAISILTFAYGIKKASFTICGLIMYLNPTIQFLLGVFIYKEPFNFVTFITFSLIWLAVLLFIKGSIVKNLQ